MNVQKADFGKAKLAALKLLERMGIEEPAVDPVKVAEALGVKVLFVDFSGQSEDSVSGYFDPDLNVIVVNKREYAPRQTFTVAHELGHKVLHEEWARSENYEVLLRDPKMSDNTPIEQEANFFAANLLMPKFMMDHYYSLPEHRIASVFAVSVPALRARLQSLYGI